MYYLKYQNFVLEKEKGDVIHFDLTDGLKVKTLKFAHVMSSQNRNLCQIVHIEKEGKNAKKMIVPSAWSCAKKSRLKFVRFPRKLR